MKTRHSVDFEDGFSEAPAQMALAERLASFFAERGHELFLVGGAVRNQLLAFPNHELDFATSSPPAQTAELLELFGSRPAHRLGEKYGTIGITIEGWKVEITTYRSSEVYPAGSRKPEVQFGRSIAEDLSRRDFTINAIAFDPLTKQTIDPFGGTVDARHRLLRAVGDPAERFREDPLRLMRGIRFAAQLAFTIEPETWAAMKHAAPLLKVISRERIRDEYSKDLTGAHPDVALTLLRDTGLMAHSVPELMALTTMPDHGPSHPLSLWDHTMRVVSAVSPVLVLRWAALLHDIAKPATRTIDPDGRTRFFHHESEGAEVARRILRNLRYPATDIEDVFLLINTHMQIHAYSPEWSDGAVRRLCLRLGQRVEAALELARADAGGHSADGESYNAPKYGALEERVERLGSDTVQTMRSPLSGDDLIAHYGRAPGPWVGAIKAKLLDEVVEGNLGPDDMDEAWRIADRVLASDW